MAAGAPGSSSNAAKIELPRQHFDLAVDPGDDLELALVGAAFIACDGAIVALGEHDAGKHASRFLDHVAAWRYDRPTRIRDCLAAVITDELESDQRGTVIDCHVRELAGLHPDVGPYDRIGVAIIRNDVVVAFRHH